MTSIGIVAHPARAGAAMRLLHDYAAQVASIDHAGIGCTANHLRVLSMLSAAQDWAVVLEDDAVPCAQFRDALARYLNDAPAPIVSLYLGTGRWAGTIGPLHGPRVAWLVDEANESGSPWISAQSLWHAVGYAIRADLVADLIAHVNPGQDIDKAITAWARARGYDIAYTWPSLVDHADEDPVITSTKGRTRIVARRAWKVLGDTP